MSRVPSCFKRICLNQLIYHQSQCTEALFYLSSPCLRLCHFSTTSRRGRGQSAGSKEFYETPDTGDCAICRSLAHPALLQTSSKARFTTLSTVARGRETCTYPYSDFFSGRSGVSEESCFSVSGTTWCLGSSSCRGSSTGGAMPLPVERCAHGSPLQRPKMAP